MTREVEVRSRIDVDAYVRLLEALREQALPAREAGPDLGRSAAALRAVIEFLDSDPLVFAMGWTSNLAALRNAIADLGGGGKSKLFDVEKVSNRPVKPSLNAIRGVAAHVCSVLMGAGYEKPDAAALVARELHKLHVTNNNKPIEATTVEGWRERASKASQGDQPSLAQELYADLQARVRARKPIDTRAKGKKYAIGTLSSLKNLGF